MLFILSITLITLLVIALLLFRFRKRNRIEKSIAENTDQQFQNTGKSSWIKRQFKIVNILLWGALGAFLINIGIILLLSSSILQFSVEENVSISQTPYIFGIDISHYQGLINWNEVRKSHHPIEYVFVRATMEEDGKDAYFHYNYRNAKEHQYIRGAYHYYRPYENSLKQFKNFKESVKLLPGDLPPILDIEEYSKYGNENLRKGVLSWLQLAEAHYGVKPIVYTASNFYNLVLRGHIDSYPLWIADYSHPHHRVKNLNWHFHQFTDKVRVKGINALVDGNDFRGSKIDLLKLTLQIEE